MSTLKTIIEILIVLIPISFLISFAIGCIMFNIKKSDKSDVQKLMDRIDKQSKDRILKDDD